ncbi:hypothetical protein Cpar_1808 [Chlorobaculum parvum NCIB 8327]|uniref:Teichuronopeptide biosynthesis TupA-like protein n=1 Tax=Chlorobaculum parvum (strain DSM 263 / NCIMB 8327) TaxID=517417 RepID=B3QQJ7_CHLP8|nr:ATP-grasp fold amidoligase family protein [Chlorobaculum parvum]ACF12200.1 hypothetical protein Cpar_1808 [Chlorobaculum parvum NCIB 8327]
MYYNTFFIKEFFRSANWLIFSARENATKHKKEKKRFLLKTGYHLDLDNPQSLNQKIVWKKLHDRNPLLTITADKYKVRKYVRLVLGDEVANEILVPLLYVGKNPQTIPFEKLPDTYIIKTNHASKTNIFVEPKNPAKKEQIIKRINQWMAKPYGLFAYEWAYQNIPRLFIIEKFLQDGNGASLKDYKFMMINGKCELIQVYSGRENELICSFYNAKWQYQKIQWKNKYGPIIEKPAVLEKMITIAEKLSSPFDFVRVDLYEISNRIYFGELTHYPASGRLEISPKNIDFLLGSKWSQKKNYWKDRKNPSISIYNTLKKNAPSKSELPLHHADKKTAIVNQ